MFTLTFKTDNDAFTDSEGNPGSWEIERILTHVIMQVVEGATNGNVVDVNGNTIGKWDYTIP